MRWSSSIRYWVDSASVLLGTRRSDTSRGVTPLPFSVSGEIGPKLLSVVLEDIRGSGVTVIPPESIGPEVFPCGPPAGSAISGLDRICGTVCAELDGDADGEQDGELCIGEGVCV